MIWGGQFWEQPCLEAEAALGLGFGPIEPLRLSQALDDGRVDFYPWEVLASFILCLPTTSMLEVVI